MRRDRQAQLSIARTRKPGSFDEFRAHLNLPDVPDDIVRAVRNNMVDMLPEIGSCPFPLLATDRWQEDLRLDEDDVAMDLFSWVCKECALSTRQSDSDAIQTEEMAKTVADIIRWFAALPPANPAHKPGRPER